MLQELMGLLENLALYRVTNKSNQQISQRLLMQRLGVVSQLIQNTLVFSRFGVKKNTPGRKRNKRSLTKQNDSNP